MSKDIRSFFTVKSSAAGQKKSSSPQETIKKSSHKKRAVILIDSDSDEDSNLSNSKRSKASLPIAKEKNASSNKQVEESKITSKYFETNKVNAIDVFGSRPIKRDNSRNIIKKFVTKEVKEFHFDKEFESELAQLCEVDIDALTNGIIENKIDPVNKETKADHNDFDKKIENNNTKHKIERSKLESGVEDDDDEIEIPKKKIKIEKSLEIKDKQNSIDFKATEFDSEKKHSPFKKYSPEKLPQKESPVKQSTLTSFISASPKKSLVKSSPPSKKSHSDGSTRNSKDIEKHTHKNESSKDICDKGNKELIKKESPLKQIKKTVPPKTKLFAEINAKPAPTQTISSPEINVKKPEPPQIKLSPETKTKPNPPETKSSPDKDSSAFSLWVEKYKPTSTKQIIGQQGEKSCVNKLTVWLKNWEKNQSGNKKLAKPSPWAKNDDGAYFKAALLSGPPGVGKTTTAHLVSKELGFDVVEFNASDTRSKKLLHQEVSELLSTKSLSPYFTGKGEQVTQHHVLLMDEVDGMAGNEDRGGVQELIQLIRQSKVPIICMCNDRNHPKIRSLANYCFDLRFSKPRAEQIRGAMLSMCFKEKMKINPNDLLSVISSANQDIRLIINHLSMLSMEKTNLANSTKHVKMGPWDFTRKIFSEEEHKSMSIYDKCDLFFHDYSLTPLFVQENYLNAVPHKPEAKNKIKKMELFAAAARSLSLGDLTEKRIRSNNAWNLLPVQAVFSSLVPGEILEGHIGAQIAFPGWFGKNSRQTKMNRLLQELTVHSRLKISGNKEAMNLDYLAPLQNSIVGPLVRDGSEGVQQALATLEEYCLVREDLESLSELTSWPGTRNQFSDVESKVKAALTRAYNKTAAPTPYAAVPIKKGNKAEVDSEDLFAEENGSQDPEDEEESLEVDSMIVVKKKTSSKKVDKEARPTTSKGNKTSKRGRKK